VNPSNLSRIFRIDDKNSDFIIILEVS